MLTDVMLNTVEKNTIKVDTVQLGDAPAVAMPSPGASVAGDSAASFIASGPREDTLSNNFTNGSQTESSLMCAEILKLQQVDNKWPEIHAYIAKTWDTLTRGPKAIEETVYDGMLERYAPVYVAFTEDADKVYNTLKSQVSPEFAKKLDVCTLPLDGKFTDRHGQFPHGLLYVPGRYVVPGGRFNELYGWDSYFIVEGLIRSGRIGLAQEMTDAQLYEVDHYGTVLNANRTYFLTRSQPPVLSKMVLALHQYSPDVERLEKAVPLLEKLHHYWTSGDCLDAPTGLSRFYDQADGPSDEVVASERDEEGYTHYERLELYFQENLEKYQAQVPDLWRYYDANTGKLTDEFYRGDRAMRASGFDPTNRFGPFSGACHQHLPVCLNSLLYDMEKDLEAIHDELDNHRVASYYRKLAKRRKQAMQELFWSHEDRCFQDWDIIRGERRNYPFLSMFYPLWAGWATQEQAKIIVKEHLPKFMRAGGLVASLQVTGNQWDAPFGWAPLHLSVVEGLHRYGFHEEAAEIRRRFLSMIHDDFDRCGTLLEKYDVETRSGQVADHIDFGYCENQEGFGWTNGVVLMLLEDYAKYNETGDVHTL